MDAVGLKVAPGIRTPSIYVSTAGSVFSHHVEDYSLASMNLMYSGTTKIWYGVSLDDLQRFKRFVLNQVLGKKEVCSTYKKSCLTEEAILSHKCFFIRPEALIANGMKVYRVSRVFRVNRQVRSFIVLFLSFFLFQIAQKTGDLVFTVPNGVHGGINLGANVNEAVNLCTASMEAAVTEANNALHECPLKYVAGFPMHDRIDVRAAL